MSTRFSEEDFSALETVWPEVFTRAVGVLRRRQVPLSVAEDAVQEAVTRAIAREVPFEAADDLLRWIQTVSWRIVIDGRRREKRLSYELPEVAASDNTEQAVEAQLRLARVRELVFTLSPADYDALIGNHNRCHTSRKAAVRSAVRRHRVRTRLLILLNGTGVFLGWRACRMTARSSRVMALAAAVAPVVAMSILALAPELRLLPKSAETREVTMLPGSVGSSSPSAPFTIETDQPAVESPVPRRSPPAPSRPDVQIDHPSPAGRGGIVIGDKQPDDSVLCVDLVAVGASCVNAPVQLTD